MSSLHLDALLSVLSQNFSVQQYNDENLNTDAVLSSDGEPGISSTCVTMTGCHTMGRCVE